MCKAIEDMQRKSAELAHINDIRNVMESFHVDAERAMQVLKIPRNEYKKYLSML